MGEGVICCKVRKNGALDIFRGAIMRGNLNLYTVIIAVPFFKRKGEKKIMARLMLPKEQWV